MQKKSLLVGLLTFAFLASPQAFAQQADAMLELGTSVSQANFGEEFDLQVTLRNPGLQNIISVRSWLEYNPNALEAISLQTQGTPFDLSAPGEDKVDAPEKLIKIGRSNVNGGISLPEVQVALVRFRVKTEQPMNTSVDFHNYQVSELGHTSVNIVEEGFPVNILSNRPDGVVIALNGGAPTEVGGPEPESQTVSDLANLQRPQNLRVNTGDGYADLRWDMGLEPDLAGYYVYYGRSSGQYTRRRAVGKVSSFRLEGLKNGDTYYFAVTAHDSQNRESDYSDEVGVIIGQPLSSTAPFEDLLNLMLAKLPSQPQNGPLAGWLIFSSLGLALVFFRKKKLQPLGST